MSLYIQRSRLTFALVAVIALFGVAGTSAVAQTKPTPKPKPPQFPPHSQVLNGYTKVISTADGAPGFYTLWVRKKDGRMLAELPRSYASQKQFFAMTVSSGERMAGLQANDMYVYWRRFDKRLALIQPNIRTRSSGDAESKDSVKRLFTDRVILDVPILTMGPSGTPVIDMNNLLISQSSRFFGFRASNSNLVTIKKAKAFPKNIEVAFEVPTTGNFPVLSGTLQTLHYSISAISSSPGYQPRIADERIGYFTTAYSDYGKYKDDEVRVRYINRWHLTKRDSKLKLSPPARPIVFYIEHTTPVRYRRWVREGILHWNKAFEKIGIKDAIEVYYQDAKLGKERGYMDKDPEDVRWNFVRWLNNDIGTAIGPSRVNPMTGEILDADIILTDGWMRHYHGQFEELLTDVAMEGMSVETLAWLAQHPKWDPRLRLAHPGKRARLAKEIMKQSMQPLAGHPAGNIRTRLLGDDPFDGLIGRTSQVNGFCLASQGKSFDLALMRASLALFGEETDDEKKKKKKKKKGKKGKKEDAADDKEKKDDADKKDEKKAEDDKDAEKKDDDKDGDKKDGDKKDGEKKDEKKEEKKSDESLIDGMPESFIGPLVAELVAHEVGHTLGLRHNFKASSVYTLAEINSAKMKGKMPLAGSVMDYLPININLESGEIQGDYTMNGIGPYDYWAIEYGYTLEKDLKPILQRVAEPELAFATDDDISGPDPYARRYDYSKNPIDYGKNQVRLAIHHRNRLLKSFVKDGQSWSKARYGYEMTLNLQTRATSMMANWIGGAYYHRDKKGDKGNRKPIVVVDPALQRDALKFVIENTFNDEVFGLTPELLSHLSVDKWSDGGGFHRSFLQETAWPVHDKVMGIQASALTMLMNPTTLKRVYDNEFRIEAEKDTITLPEMLTTIGDSIWTELDKVPAEKHTARNPLISSLRRNLQDEHLDRLVDLVMPGSGSTEAHKPISNLALLELKKIVGKSKALLKKGGKKIDPYTAAHLTKVETKIEKALNAQYIYNANDIRGSGGGGFFIFGETEKKNRDD